MSELRCHAEDYLRLRRSLGFKLTARTARCSRSSSTTSRPPTRRRSRPSWPSPLPSSRRASSRSVWAHRLSMVRGFARYMQAIDPTTEIPPHDVFAARYQRPTPYLWQETEVLDLMAAARQLRPPLCALTYETFFGLLWCTGMRIGETIGLQRGDVDLSAGVITVREAKLGRSRLVPLQQSATNTLTSYAASRDRLCPQPRSQTFFVSSRRHHFDPPSRATDLPPPRRQDRPAHRDEEASCP